MTTTSMPRQTLPAPPPARLSRGRPGARELHRAPYDLYSADNHDVWSPVRADARAWERYATPAFSRGWRPALDPDRVPRLETQSLHGTAHRLPARAQRLLPAYLFFDSLRSASFRPPSRSAMARCSTISPSRTSSRHRRHVPMPRSRVLPTRWSPSANVPATPRAVPRRLPMSTNGCVG